MAESPQPMAGPVHCQFKGKGSFVAVHLALADGQLVFRADGPDGEQLRTAEVGGCTCGVLKKPRKGHPHGFRVDLNKPDTQKVSKYVLSVADKADLRLWMDAFGAYSDMSAAEISAAQEAAALGLSKKKAAKAEKKAQKELKKELRKVRPPRPSRVALTRSNAGGACAVAESGAQKRRHASTVATGGGSGERGGCKGLRRRGRGGCCCQPTH